MAKKLTKKEFVERSSLVHNEKYDYSDVIYVNNSTKVLIVCPFHGAFLQTPNHHLNGHGCPKCKNEQFSKRLSGVARIVSRKKVCGIGIYDLDSALDYDTRKIYNIWRAMIKRCYDLEDNRNNTYKDCRVCDEWLTFSNFHKWYIQHYIKDWCLDKDILIQGNRLYSPSTCCFVPQEINCMFNRHQNGRGKSNVCGVQFYNNKYHVCLSMYGKNTYVGTFNDLNEAFSAYKGLKEKYIKEMADKWKDKIASNVYESMMSYEVKLYD